MADMGGAPTGGSIYDIGTKVASGYGFGPEKKKSSKGSMKKSKKERFVASRSKK